MRRASEDRSNLLSKQSQVERAIQQFADEIYTIHSAIKVSPGLLFTVIISGVTHTGLDMIHLLQGEESKRRAISDGVIQGVNTSIAAILKDVEDVKQSVSGSSTALKHYFPSQNKNKVVI